MQLPLKLNLRPHQERKSKCLKANSGQVSNRRIKEPLKDFFQQRILMTSFLIDKIYL